jgi:fibronectin-binding autotransporter adhesin
MGSQLVLNGDVTTAGFAPSRINFDAAGGSTGALSLDLSSTPGDVNRNLNIAGGGADLTVGIPIVNGAATTASITKAGPGTLTLSAINTYNGSTNIKEGTVVVSGTAAGSAAIVGNSAIPATPAILTGGNGAASATPTLSDISGIASGARIDPGVSEFSAGILNTNTFSLTNSAHLTIQIGGTVAGGNGIDGYDRINVLSSTTSAAVSGGFLDLADMSLSVLPSDSLLFVLVNNGSGPSSAPFGGVTLDGSPVANLNNIVIGGQPFALIYNAHFDGVSGSYGGVATGGNDIALVAVPEPLSAATLFGSVALLALRRRRRD